VFARCSTIYTVGVETVKLVDKDGHGRVIIVKQKSVISLDKDSLKKSSGTNSSRKYRQQHSYLSKYPLFPFTLVSLALTVSRHSFMFDDDSSVSSSQSFTQKVFSSCYLSSSHRLSLIESSDCLS
jgi:hypothetical protein